jgi:hypothetical protein
MKVTDCLMQVCDSSPLGQVFLRVFCNLIFLCAFILLCPIQNWRRTENGCLLYVLYVWVWYGAVCNVYLMINFKYLV